MYEETCQENKVIEFARIDGYHLATRRADRKDQVTISVKLFEGTPEKHRYAGVIMFRRKNLPDDCVRRTNGNTLIYMNALLTDYDPLMEMIAGELPVAIEYMGESDEKGRAYLKSLAYVFPGRKKEQTPVPPTGDDCE